MLLGRKLFVVVVLTGLLMPAVAYQFEPLVNCDPVGTNNPDACSLADLVSIPVRIFNFLIGFAGMVLLLIIIWSGFRMMLYQFTDAPEAEIMAAKNTLRHGIFGFIIVGGSFLIVNTLLLALGFDTGTEVGIFLSPFGIGAP